MNSTSRWLLLLFAVLPCLPARAAAEPVAAAPAAVSGQSSMGPWVFGYWRGHKGRERVTALHYAWSRDGLKWTTLNGGQPVLNPTVGNKALRDIFIARGQDGMFHLLAPDLLEMLQGTRSIIHYRSKDLITWEQPQLVEVMSGNPAFRCLWGPEFLYDPQQKNYLVWWAAPNTAGNQKNLNCRLWCARTKDFTTYTQPKMLFDPGYMSIDATMVQAEDQFYLFFKDNRKENKDGAVEGQRHVVQIAKSAGIDGPFEKVGGNISREFADGPSVLQVAEKRWLLFYEDYRAARYFASESSDLENWTPIPPERCQFPDDARHGTIFPVTEQELQALIVRFAANATPPESKPTNTESSRAKR